MAITHQYILKCQCSVSSSVLLDTKKVHRLLECRPIPIHRQVCLTWIPFYRKIDFLDKLSLLNIDCSSIPSRFTWTADHIQIETCFVTALNKLPPVNIIIYQCFFLFFSVKTAVISVYWWSNIIFWQRYTGRFLPPQTCPLFSCIPHK